MRKFIFAPPGAALAALGLLLALPGCIAVVAGAAGTAGGYTLSQERSVNDQIKDATIKAQVSQNLSRYNKDMGRNLDITVYEGRVLLTGSVQNPDWRDQAVKITWQVDGVKEVYNEIEVGPPSTTMDDLADTKISTQLRSDILTDGDIRSVNYIITTSDHVVYLIGQARSPAELNRVTDYARNIANVKRVVSYVRIREGAPAGQQKPALQQQTPQQQPIGSQPAPGYGAPSYAPPQATAPAGQGRSGGIDVQPLQ